MAKSKYLDVNKEQYLKALFLDLEKDTKMVDFNNAADMIRSFILGNPSKERTTSNGLNISSDGRILISKR